jgi:hypothetical protein
MELSPMKAVAVLLPALVLPLLGTPPASGELYRWVDQNGVIHF